MDAPKEHSRDLFRVVNAVLLGLAATTTGWAAYEAAAWDAKHSDVVERAGRNDRQGLAWELKAGQSHLLDITLVEAYVAARLRGDDRAAHFYHAHLRPIVKERVDAWLKESPFDNPAYSARPLEMPVYEVPETVEARRYHEEADRQFDEARRADAIGASYVLGTVLAALVSLFAGLAETAQQRQTRRIMVVFAACAFFGAAAWVVARPVLLLH
jgi:hypothetical protein